MTTPTNPIPVQPVVLAGGDSTRLWPLSRLQHPVQFMVLAGDRSPFQRSARRLADLAAPDLEIAPACIVCSGEHRFLVIEQLREIGLPGAALLLEPAERGSAPAVTLAALHARAAGTDPVLLVTHSDQAVSDEAVVGDTLQRAVRHAAQGHLVTLGVASGRPESDRDPARAGDGYRSTGVVVVRASVWLACLERCRPEIAAAATAAWNARTVDAAFVRPEREAFAALGCASVDEAVLEPVAAAPGKGSVRTLALETGWKVLGTWDAVWQASARDEAGNASRGDVLLRGSRDTLVHATSRLVGTVGLDGIVVVETPDAVLVADRSRSAEVGQIVAELERAGRSEQTLHRKVHRPWGWYDSIDAGPRFQVKRIMVKPGASLSLQMHHHRAEHWIVVSGTAEVTCGERKLLLGENQSTYIPLGETHRLANPGKVPLEIIEVQSGSYLGEDDIVRFEDSYGRTK